MATYERLPQKKNKKEDEFISFFDRLYHKAYANGPLVIAVAVIVIIVGLGTVFWSTFHAKRSDKLAEKIFSAHQIGDKAEDEVLMDIRKSNLYAPIGIWASLELSNDAMKEGKCDDVINDLDKYVGHGENQVLRSLVYMKMGVCFENKKDWKKAESLYQQASSDSKNYLKDWSLLRLASVYQAENKKEDASKILQDLVKKDSEASPAVREEARSLLLLPQSGT